MRSLVLVLAVACFAQKEPQCNHLNVEYLNTLSDEGEKELAEVNRTGMDYLVKTHMRIVEVFTDASCEQHITATYGEAERDKYFYEFLETFVTNEGNAIPEKVVEMAKEFELYLWNAAQNKPFLTCMGDKLRDKILLKIQDCMPAELGVTYQVDKLKSLPLPDILGNEEFEKNARGLAVLFLSAAMNATLCDSFENILHAITVDRNRNFCVAADVTFGSEPGCYEWFEERCPPAAKCFKDMISNFQDTLKDVFGDVIKEVKECDTGNDPEGAPTAKEIVKSGFRMFRKFQAVLRGIRDDDNVEQLKHEARKYLESVLSAFFNEDACKCI